MASSIHAQVTDPYPKLTRHALRAPKNLKDNVLTLVPYLTSACKTEEEKLWTIYAWLIHNIQYDQEAYKNGNRRINRHNRDILDRQKAVCFGYSQLFKTMAELAGFSTEMIFGYSKGTITSAPQLNEPDHAWNAVLLEGRWRLLDVTWGRGIINQENDFVQTFHEGFFLTSPEKFIVNHLPLIPMWQLLACPIGTQDFKMEAAQIYQKAIQPDSCFNYADNIAQFLALPLPERRLKEAQLSYEFNPTTDIKEDYGHALYDYAGRLSDQADQLQSKGDISGYMALQQKAIAACQLGATLSQLFDWQIDLHAGLLLNQSIAQYSLLEDIEDPKTLETRKKNLLRQLQSAQQLIRSNDINFIRRAQLTNIDKLVDALEEF